MNIDVVERVCCRDVCLVVGSAGCGKSTFINYLLQIKLRECRLGDLNLGEQSAGQSRRVVDVSGDSSHEIHAKIDHIGMSGTTSPSVIESTDMVFVESSSLTSTSFQNMFQILQSAKSVKVVLLLDYYSLVALHKDLVKEIMRNFVEWFREGEKGFIEVANANAVLCVITKVPSLGGDEEVTTVGDVKMSLNDPFIPGGQALSMNVMVYDPLDRGSSRSFRPVSSRHELLAHIHNHMKPILEPKEIFTDISPLGSLPDNTVQQGDCRKISTVLLHFVVVGAAAHLIGKFSPIKATEKIAVPLEFMSISAIAYSIWKYSPWIDKKKFPVLFELNTAAAATYCSAKCPKLVENSDSRILLQFSAAAAAAYVIWKHFPSIQAASNRKRLVLPVVCGTILGLVVYKLLSYV